MPNRTISLPDDVMEIVTSLGVPFSVWVADQLRLHAANNSGLNFAQQLLADAALAGVDTPTVEESRKAIERMDRSAPW